MTDTLQQYRSAVVTGTTSSTGRAIALWLAAEGFDIIAHDQHAYANSPKMLDLKARIEELGRQCVPVQACLASRIGHNAIIDTALNAFGAIDVLVNNARVEPLKHIDMLNISRESFDRVLALDSRGPFFLTQGVARQMIRQVNNGRTTPRPMIIFVTSQDADVATSTRAEVCISKSAKSMTARLFANRLADVGINVYEIRPGSLDDAGSDDSLKRQFQGVIEESGVQASRTGTPEDVARAVVGLSRGYFAHSTGAVIEVGGGMTLPRV